MLDNANPYPDPQYGPFEVIEMQLAALANNDYPYDDNGISIAYRFASPANKRMTGTLDEFTSMVHNPVYAPMLNHIHAEFGVMRVNHTEIVQPIIITTGGGEKVGYVFSLSRQDRGEFERCWMTDGVLRFDIESGRTEY